MRTRLITIKVLCLVLVTISFLLSTAAENGVTPINLEKGILETPKNVYIRCFDANDDYIVIGYTINQIDIYSSNTLEYLYSFKFTVYGTYSFRIVDEQLLFFDYRMKNILIYDFNGQYIDYMKDDSFNDMHLENSNKNQVETDKNTFKVVHTDTSSEIIMKNDIDEKSILRVESYDYVNFKRRFRIRTALFYFIPTCVLVVVLIVIARTKKKKTGNISKSE